MPTSSTKKTTKASFAGSVFSSDQWTAIKNSGGFFSQMEIDFADLTSDLTIAQITGKEIWTSIGGFIPSDLKQALKNAGYKKGTCAQCPSCAQCPACHSCENTQWNTLSILMTILSAVLALVLAAVIYKR